MFVVPCRLVEFIDVRPEIVENCFSSGSATADAIVSGLAPGSEALTEMRREIDRRQVGHRQHAIRHHAEHDDAQRYECGRDWTFDEQG